MLPESQYMISKNNSQKLYYLFIKYRKLQYSDFIKNINADMDKKYDLYDLKKYILHIRKNHSTSKAKLMDDILNYTLGLNKDENSINNFTDEKFQKYITIKRKETDPSTISDLKNDIDLIITEKKSYKELSDEGKINTKGLPTKVKKYIKNIEPEKYIDYLIVNYELNVTSIKELNQFLEALNYFISNLESKLDTLNHYNSTEDEDKIRNLYVSMQENLDDYYKDNIFRLKGWKVKRLEILLDKYNKLKDMTIKIIENKNLNDLKKLSDQDMKTIRENELFVYDYYKDLAKIKQIYDNHVGNLNSLTDKSKNTIIEEFNKKLILENNN